MNGPVGNVAARLLCVVLLCGQVVVEAGRAWANVNNCTEHYTVGTPIDHFNYDATTGTYAQRYFTYNGFVSNEDRPPVVFFYCGNEDNVELYVNNTGLMWELGKQMGALLVFAEHRYYGKSNPGTGTPPACYQYLTTEQAMADYATLIHTLRLGLGDTDNHIPFIGFGGSYGGMLGSWMRMRYPDALDGMVAGSAPILSFQHLDPPYDPSTYDKLVTRDAGGPGSGAASACSGNVRAAWGRIAALSTSERGRALLSEAFATCQPVDSEGAAMELVSWVQAPLGYMAMGNYPYESDYMTHGDGKPMCAWPMRAACAHLADSALPAKGDLALLTGLRDFAGVWYNRTGVEAPCYFNGAAASRERPFVRHRRPWTRTQRDGPAHSDGCAGTWDYQYCTQMVQPFASGLGDDMFFPPSPWNVTEVADGCRKRWGVTTRPEWASIGFPGSRLGNGRFSRIVFTNGYLDPWSGGGVLHNISVADDLLAFVLPNGAHHLDLMWSHPDDPPDALQAREFIASAVARWVGGTAPARRMRPLDSLLPVGERE